MRNKRTVRVADNNIAIAEAEFCPPPNTWTLPSTSATASSCYVLRPWPLIQLCSLCEYRRVYSTENEIAQEPCMPFTEKTHIHHIRGAAAHAVKRPMIQHTTEKTRPNKRSTRTKKSVYRYGATPSKKPEKETPKPWPSLRRPSESEIRLCCASPLIA